MAALVVQFHTGWAPPTGVVYVTFNHMPTGRLSTRHPPHLTRKTPLTHHNFPQSHETASHSENMADLAPVTFIDNIFFFVVQVNVDTTKLQQEELMKHYQAIRNDLFAAVEAGLYINYSP